MATQPRTPKQRLQQENEELRARLAEAEETLRAIREGSVDAVVVSGPHGDQVFSLTSCRERLPGDRRDDERGRPDR